MSRKEYVPLVRSLETSTNFLTYYNTQKYSNDVATAHPMSERLELLKSHNNLSTYYDHYLKNNLISERRFSILKVKLPLFRRT